MTRIERRGSMADGEIYGIAWGKTEGETTQLRFPRFPQNIQIQEFCQDSVRLVSRGAEGFHSLLVSPEHQVAAVFEGNTTQVSLQQLIDQYREIGPLVVQKLPGEFSLALWDWNTRSLLLARDQVGTRPLYYAVVSGTVFFSSDLRRLFSLMGKRPAFSTSSLVSYFSFLYPAAPFTMFEGVRQLRPREILMFRERGRCQSLWQRSSQSSSQNLDGVAADVRQRFTTAVQGTLLPKPPIYLLSSGVDSSTTAALASRLSPSIRTLTLGFADCPTFDERAEARQIASHIGSSHSEICVSSECLAGLDFVHLSLGAPAGDPSALLTWDMLRQIPPGECVVCGDGGNEVFGGVPKFFQLMSLLTGAKIGRAWKLFHGLAQRFWYYLTSFGAEGFFHRLAHLYFRWIGKRGQRVSQAMSRPEFESALTQYTALESIWSRQNLLDILSPELQATAQPQLAESIFREALEDKESPDLVSQLIRLRLNTFITGNCIPYMERPAAYLGINTRFPYLDRDLSDYLCSVPVSLNYGPGYRHLMKKALGDLIPQEAYGRVKGYNAPLETWMRSPSWTQWIGDILHSQSLRQRGWFDCKKLTSLQRRFQKGEVSIPTERSERRQPVGLSLWTIVALESFCQTFEKEC